MLIVVTMQNLIMLLALQAARAFVAPTARRMATSLKAGDAMAVDAATTFLFPGQGAQSVGMAVETCEAVPAAKKLFDEASEILGYDLLAKCAEGPKAELDSTAVSQPAIFVSSMAAVEKLRAESPDVVDSATCAMGLSLESTRPSASPGRSASPTASSSRNCGARRCRRRRTRSRPAWCPLLVWTRARSPIYVKRRRTRRASPSPSRTSCATATTRAPAAWSVVPRALGAFFRVRPAHGRDGGDAPGPVASARRRRREKVAISPVNRARQARVQFKARMAVKLAVAGAFHTDFMAPAVAALSAALADTDVQAPRIPVVSNVDAAAHADPAVIKDLLAKQVTSPVLFEDSVANLLGAGFAQAPLQPARASHRGHLRASTGRRRPVAGRWWMPAANVVVRTTFGS